MKTTEQYTVLYCGTVCYVVQGGSNVLVWMKSCSVAIQMKATYWAVLSCGASVYYAVQGLDLTFASMD